MKIHEYSSQSHSCPVPASRCPGAKLHSTPLMLERSLGAWAAGTVVVKAQIHAGGRGKGGGVKLAKSPDEAEQIAASMIGMTLVTHQTGPEGPRRLRACSSKKGCR